MKFILGKKQHMTQIFTEDGSAIPATVLSASNVVATQIKTKEKDGYNAVQFGHGEKASKNISKAIKGHVKDMGNFATLKEYRTEEVGGIEKGTKIDLSQFTEGDKVTVVSISKGKGFQGVVKRHGFAGGRRSHGQKHSEREPGSIGIGGVQRVFKGTRMAGRMGSDKITLKGVEVLKVLPETEEIILKGAIPGRRGTLVEVRG